MLKPIDKALKSVTNGISLYFVLRKTDEEKRYRYNIYSSTISLEIGKELVNSARDQVERNIKAEPEYLEYGILLASDSPIVEYIDSSDVPYLNQIIANINSEGLDTVTKKEFSSVFGYIVRLETENKALYLFKKTNPQRLLQKGFISSKFKDGKFESTNSEILTLENAYDCILLIENSKEPEKKSDEEKEKKKVNNLFIFQKKFFESFFNFNEYYVSEIDKNRKTLENIKFVCKLEPVIDFCREHGLMVKKLGKIVSNGSLNPDFFTKENVEKICEDYNEKIEYDDKGIPVLTQANIWAILRVLDDDYLKSSLTENKYLSRSKSKR